MAKSNLDKNALSYAVLSKIYMVNFIVIAALICVAGFGVNLKFEDVKGEIYAQNAYFSNFLSERFAAADSELRLIEKYLAANAADVKTVFEFSLNNSPEYVAFFIADKNGEIKFKISPPKTSASIKFEIKIAPTKAFIIILVLK